MRLSTRKAMLLRGEDRELRHRGMAYYKNLAHESGVRRRARRRLHRFERRLARITPMEAMTQYVVEMALELEIERAAQLEAELEEYDDWLDMTLGPAWDDEYDWRLD